MKSERSARVARFHLEQVLNSHTELTLPKAASHHLITVLRNKPGDVIDLFNGDGYNYRATIIGTGQRAPGKLAQLQIHERTEIATESPIRITLVQGISRGDRMDTSLRQSVELGVCIIQPLYSRHSAKALDEKRAAKKQEHWQNIIVSACEQSGRGVVPELKLPISLSEWTASLKTSGQLTSSQQQASPSAISPTVTSPAGTSSPDTYSQMAEPVSARQAHAFILSPTAERSLTEHLLHGRPGAQDIAMLVGPETGFDHDEIEMASTAGVTPVRMGPRVLRTETAGPACITLVQSTIGDMR